MNNVIFLEIPTVCPVCGGPTVIRNDFLYCDNPHCEGKFINKLEHFCGKKGLDIKGLSEATLQKLVDWGWVGNYQELFSLSNFREEWIDKPGFGSRSVDNLLNAIEKAKNCELWKFISALSIPNIGTTYAKEIARNKQTWADFRKDIDNHFDFSTWDGFGYVMDDSLHNFDYWEADKLVNEILNIQNTLWIDPNSSPVENSSSIQGKVFVITGAVHTFKNRDEAKAAIEEKGGKVAGSVSKNTDYLVTNDATSGSSKNVKAKQLGIPIISEDELIAML